MEVFEKKLPDAELEIMKIIWHHPVPISTSEVKRIADEEGNGWKQSTVQTLLNRLIAKNFLEKGKSGKEYTYMPLVAEKDYMAFENELFLKKLHGNSVLHFVRALFDSKKISAKDIQELETFFKTQNGHEDTEK